MSDLYIHSPAAATAWELLRMKWRHRFSLFHLLAEKDCGNDGPPLNHRSISVNDGGFERVFCILNDSFEIGIGWPAHWDTTVERKAIHKFIWWYLRLWIFSDWFGLRRWAWYKLLRRRVEKSRRFGTLTRHM
jgi:hypothetical protein